MVTHKCSQGENIKQLEKSQATLENNQKNVMEILEEMRTDVREIKDFLFKGDLTKLYVPREIFNTEISNLKLTIKEREIQISKLERAQNRVAWLIISGVIVAVLATVIVK